MAVAVISGIVCLAGFVAFFTLPKIQSAWQKWRAKTAEPPADLSDNELDEESKQFLSAARALLVARMRAKNNPDLKAEIEKSLGCLPKFVCGKGGASNA